VQDKNKTEFNEAGRVKKALLEKLAELYGLSFEEFVLGKKRLISERDPDLLNGLLEAREAFINRVAILITLLRKYEYALRILSEEDPILKVAADDINRDIEAVKDYSITPTYQDLLLVLANTLQRSAKYVQGSNLSESIKKALLDDLEEMSNYSMRLSFLLEEYHLFLNILEQKYGVEASMIVLLDDDDVEGDY
jgi:hypothetical protein